MRRGRVEWERIVVEFETSGATHAEFCRRGRLSLHTFRRWLYRLRDARSGGTVARSATKAVQMVPVRIRESAREAGREDLIEVVVGALVVRVRVGQPAAYIGELVAALAARC
jgi:hypothetical protein